MELERKPYKWSVLSSSVRGASHCRSGLPNQDAIKVWCNKENGYKVVLAVSDGHGSSKYIRSDVGSKIAVESAVYLMREFIINQKLPSMSAVKRLVEERFPKEIETMWKRDVLAHFEANPVTQEEIEKLGGEESQRIYQNIEKNPVTVYGATLLVVAVTEDYIIYMQIGDGDILTVSKSGEVYQPIRVDPRLFANETTSLSSKESWRDFRVSFQPLDGIPPVLILASTDGYANSFRTLEGFLKVGSDLLEMINENGLEDIQNSMENWLEEASQAGSGDDISLGLLFRHN